MLIYNGQIIAGGGTIVLPMTRAEYEANKAILDSADVWVDLTDEPDQVAEADQIAFWVGQTQKGMGYIGDIATKAVAKAEPTDTALYLHEVGEYFINKDGDACKVDLQIPVDGTITLGTNCHVLTKGVANDIGGNLTIKSYVVTMNPDTSVSGYSKIGNTAIPSEDLSAYGTPYSALAQDMGIAVCINSNRIYVASNRADNAHAIKVTFAKHIIAI